MASSPASASSGDERARLRQLVWFDIATACTAVAVMSATYALVTRNGWLLVLCGLVSFSGAAMAGGLRPLARGDLSAAVGWLAGANWAVALAASAIATFAWPLMVLAALLPAVFAAPYVPPRRLGTYVVMSLGVCLGVAALGLLQDFSGFSDELPSWLAPTILLLFVPFLAGMLLTTAVQHSRRLQASLAETTAANRALEASRLRLVTATDRERRRMERDLHDGAQQRLVALGLRLRALQVRGELDPAGALGELGDLRAEVREAHRELRELAQGIYPPVLTQHGLADALGSAVDRSGIEAHLDVTSRRFPPELEATVYFCCVEALQNVLKHAGDGARAWVSVRPADGELVFTVRDDGVGFTDQPQGTGLDNLRDRLAAAGAALEITSTPGFGTVVSGRIPVPA